MLSCYKQWTNHVKSTSYLVFNHCPYHTSHFITVHLNNRTINFYFCCVAICKSSRHQLPDIKNSKPISQLNLGFEIFRVLRTFLRPKNTKYYYLQFLCFLWSLKEREEPIGRKTLRVTKKESQEHLTNAAIFQPSTTAKQKCRQRRNGGDLALGKRGKSGKRWGNLPAVMSYVADMSFEVMWNTEPIYHAFYLITRRVRLVTKLRCSSVFEQNWFFEG